jgi:hypothetical protein
MASGSGLTALHLFFFFFFCCFFCALAASGAAPDRGVAGGTAAGGAPGLAGGSAPPASAAPPARAHRPGQPLAQPLIPPVTATPPVTAIPGADDAPPPDEYRLHRAQDGSGDLIYEAPGFTARVARDGSVIFRPRHLSKLSLLLALPGPPPPSGVPTLEGTLRGLGKKKRPRAPEPGRDPTADETRDPSTTVSRYRPDPREICQYPRPCFFDASVLLLGARARFDLTDELMRFSGQDPYRYQEARFLAATHEMRVRMAARAHAEDLAQSRGNLAGRLASIACDDRRPPSERRAILQALRAEMDVATPGGRAQAEAIGSFLEELDRHDGGARCPAR